MAQQNLGGGIPPNFLANLPSVPQATKTCGFVPNHLENQLAKSYTAAVSQPVPGRQNQAG